MNNGSRPSPCAIRFVFAFMVAAACLIGAALPSYAADTTPPNPPGTVNDGTGSDIDWTNSTTQLSANWTAASDPESGIDHYEYAIGTTPGASDIVGFTSVGLNLSVTRTGLSLSNATTYYFSIKAFNGVGQTAVANSDGATVDTSPPPQIASVKDLWDDGTSIERDWTSSTTTLKGEWTATADLQSGVAYYQYAIGTVAGGADVVGWTSVGISYTETRSGLSLSNGQIYYFSARAVNNAGGISTTQSSDGITVDTSAPSAIAWVDDLRDMTTPGDIDFTDNTGTLYSDWSDSSDPGSGIDKYQYAVGTTPGGTSVVGWSTSLDSEAIISGLTLANGQIYYVSAKAISNTGAESAVTTADGITVDTTPPPAVTTVNDGTGADIDVTNSLTELSANWTATSDPESGIKAYWFKVGTTAGGDDTIPWQNNGTDTSVTMSGLSLTNGQTYYFTVVATNNMDMASAETSSDGQTVDFEDTTPPADMAEVSDTWDGEFFEVDWASSTTQFSGAWTDSTDPESGITKYYYAIGTSAGGTDVVGWTDNGLNTYFTRTGLSLTNGSTYYVTAKAANGAIPALESNPVNSDGATIDTTPPTNIATANDGTGADIDTTDMATQLSANWSDATDGESGIYQYWYIIGTSPGASDVVGWTNNWNSTSVTHTGLSLTNGQTYYFTIRGLNGAGTYTSNISTDGQTVDVVDVTPPSDIATVDDYVYSATDSVLMAEWTASSDPESSIARYWFGIGTAPGNTDISAWYDIGTNLSAASSGLSLNHGQTYYFTVMAENGAGLLSNQTNSDGVLVDITAPADIATVNDGTGADIDVTNSGTELSANWSDSSDPESGVARYWFAAGTTPGATDTIDWTATTTTTVTVMGLSLTNGQTYYFTVKAENGAGTQSGTTSSDGQLVDIVDVTPPTDITQVSDGDYTNSTTELQAGWSTSSDPESGVEKYWYAIGTSPGGTDVVGWTDNGLSIGTLHTGLSLTNGAIYYFTVKAENGVGLQSNPTNSDGVLVDTSPPSDIATVNDGTGADIDITASWTELSANWSTSSDAQSGIIAYFYGIGTTPGATDTTAGWIDNGTSTAVTHTGLSLTNLQFYYFTVQAMNGAGSFSNVTNSDGQQVDISDSTPPADIATVNDGTGVDIEYTSSGTQLEANWTASSDPESGISKYWYAIGTSAGGTDVVGWTDNGLSTSVTRAGLTLTDGQDYYFSVTAENGVGLQSSPTNSNGQVSDTSPPANITTVNDGTGSDIDVTNDGTELSANWTATSDTHSGIAKYWYAIGTFAGGTDVVGWTDNGNVNFVTHTGLALIQWQTYYFTVMAENGAGLQSGVTNSDGQMADFDVTPPSDVPYVNDGSGADIDVTGSGTSLTANWGQSTDDESGILRYWYSIGTTAGASDTVSWTDNGLARSRTRTGLSLTSGQIYHFTVKAENGANIESAGVTTSDGQMVDLTPPADVATVNDGTGADIDETSSSTELSANWTASSDLESGVAKYYYAIGTSAGATDTVNWTNNDTATSVTRTGLSLSHGQTYYFSIKAENGVYLQSNPVNSNGQTVNIADASPPTDISTVDDGDWEGSTTQLSASWSASSDPETGISAYWYSIGTTAGASDTASWTDNGTTRSVTHTGLSLTDGQTYYFTVKAENGVGLFSNTTSSDGVTVDASPPADVATVNDGTGADVDTTTVLTEISANWSDSSDAQSGVASYLYAIGTAPGATDTVGWTNNGTFTSVTRTGLSLTPGQTYYVSVKAVNGAGLESNPASSDGQVAQDDTTPPSDIATVDDGTGADIDFTGSTTNLSANWGASSDPESGVSRYWYSIGTSAGASDTADWTNNGTARSITRTGLSLTGGQTYYFTVKAENGVGLESNTTSSDGATIDTTPPADITGLNDGTGADIDTTSSVTELSANWNASSDAESDVAKYLYAIGTTPGATNTINWTNNGTSTSVTKTGLGLTNGVTYYFTVKAENGVYLQSTPVNSDGQTVSISDSTPPDDISSVNDGDWTGSLTELSASWTTSSDPDSGIAAYWYSIGTTAGASDTVSWTDNGLDTSVTHTGLSLTDGQTYYFSVRAENGVGLFSNPTNSDGQTVDTTPPSDVATVNDGTGADIDDAYSTTQLSANWTTSADAQSGIAKYYYAIGTAPGATDTADWTNNGNFTSVTRDGLSLTVGQIYYFSIKSENAAGLQSGVTSSDGQVAQSDTTPPSQVSLLNDGLGADIDVTGQTTQLSANWAESSDPESGIARYWYSAGTSPGASDTISWTDIGTGLSVTHIGLTLTGGQMYYFTVKAENGDGLMSTTRESDGVIVDDSPPADVATVNDGTGADIDVTTSGTELSANWTASSDPESGIKRYYYAIGTTPGATDTVNWTNNDLNTSVTYTGLTLTHGQTYYFSVKAENGVFLESNPVSSDGQTVNISDATPPADISSVTDGDWEGTTTQLSASWTASSDPESGIKRYWYSIGTSAGASDTVSWTDNGTDISVTRTGLSLTDGQTYYFSVKAENGVGLESNPTNSDGVTIDATPPADITTLNDGTGADIDVTTVLTELSANWTDSSDAQSGVAKYIFAIGTSPGATDTVTWSNNGTYTYFTKTGLSLTPGTTYYVTVKAENGAALQSNTITSNGVLAQLDGTPPPAITTVNDGTGADIDFTGSTTQLAANWSEASDPESGISKYYYAIGTTPGATDTADWTNTGLVRSITRTGLTLTGGQTYYFTVKAENGAGLQSTPTNSDGIVVDTSPPADVATVNDGTGADIDVTNSGTELSANWTDSSDPESGVTKYFYAIGTVPGSTEIVDWTDIGLSTSVTRSNLTLYDGTTYYFTIKAENGVYLQSNPVNSDGQTVDIVDPTPPSDITSVDDGDWAGSLTELSASWSASSDPDSGIAKYWYAIGTASGATDVVTWTDISTNLSVTHTGLSLTDGQTYFFSVIAENGAGLQSNPKSSDGQTVDITPPTDVTSLNDGTGADIDTTSVLTELSANWAASSDGESGIARYFYAIGTSPGATDTVNWTNNGNFTERTHNGLDLTPGQTYYFSVIAENGAGVQSSATSSDGVTAQADITPPSDAFSVRDGTGADIDVTGLTTQLSANWDASSDPETGIAAYRYSIGTTPGASDTVSWTNNGTGRSITKTGLTLTGGQSYYFTVMAENGAGLFSNPKSSDGVVVDDSPPTDIATVDDGTGADIDVTTSGTELSANWTNSSDPESGISKYWYAIGTTPGGTDIVGWTDNGLTASVTRTGMALTDGQTYYFTVKAENTVFLQSNPVSSDGQTVDVSPPVQSSWVPSEGSTLSTTSPSISFNTDENASCRWSLSDAAYGSIPSTSDCAGGGTLSHTCDTSGLSEGAENVYIACADTYGNEDTATTNEELSYTIDTTPPAQSAWNPADGSTIDTQSPTITLGTDENATCKWSLTDDDYTTMVNTCSGGGTTSHTCDTSGLSEGAEVVYIACTDPFANEDTAATNTELNYTVDTSPPTDITAVNDGTGADIDTTTSGTQLSANWTDSSDPQTGIASYWYAIGTTAGATDTVDWTDNGTATSVTRTGLALTNGQDYYFTIKAENGTGLQSNTTSSDGQTANFADSTPPSDIATVNDGSGADIDVTGNTTQLSANWDASSDPESGISAYLYAIGTSPGATDTADWTNNGTARSVTRTGLSLTDGVTYYFSVKAENGDGLQSNPTDSDGQVVDASPPADVTTVNDGTGADIDLTTSSSELSANWDTSSDPQSGIKKYWYAIGTTAGATDTWPWTDNGLATGVTKIGLSLTDGQTYYFSVKAENGVYLQSNPVSSDGQMVDSSLPVQSNWSPADGSTLTSTSQAITLDTNENATCKWSLSDAAYAFIPGGNTCAGGGTMSHTCDSTGLVEGAEVVYIACADMNGNEDTASTNTHLNYTVDTLSPVQSNWNPADGSTLNTTSPAIALDTDENATCRWSLTDDDYSAMTDTCAGSGTTSHTCNTIGLTEGAEVVYTACGDPNGNDDTAATNIHLNYTVDTSPPADITTVNDGTGADIDVVSSGTQLSANWTDSSDAESGISRYWYAIGTSPGGTDTAGWTDNGTGTSVTRSGLALTDGQTYYFTVKAENGAGLQSNTTSSDGQQASFGDSTPPTDIASINDGLGADTDVTGYTTQLSANWDASSDPESGILQYWYAIGTSPGATDTVDWTSNGTARSVTRTGLSLTDGQTYYFTVKAENGVGMESNTITSDGQTVDASPPSDIATVNDGTGVDIDITNSSYELSATWTESSDPQSGIKRYWYAIGTSPGATDTINWTDNGLNTSFTRAGLVLVDGQTYYTTVKAENNVWLESAPVSSDGVTVDISLPSQSNWNPADGSTITTSSPSITLSTSEDATCKWSLSDQAYGTMTDTCAGGGTTSHSCSTSGLVEGTEVVSIACADMNGNEDTTSTNTELNYTVDTTPPVQSAWDPADGTFITTTSPTITLSTNENAACRWSLSDDAYSAMIDTCTGGGTTSHSCSTSGLAEGAEIVYIACSDTNGNEDTAATNDELNYTVDSTPPTDVATVNDGTGADIDVTTSGTELSANWTASSDAQSGVSSYLYAIGTTAGGTDVVAWTNNGLNTSVTRTGMSLTNGQTYYFTVKAENGVGLQSNPASSDGQTASFGDSTPPSDIASVSDGTGADTDITGLTTQLSANWTASSDAESGVARYWYAVGTTAGATDTVSWTDNGTARSVTHTGLSLTDGQTYYFTVKAENGVGLESTPTNSDGIVVDASPPTDVATVNDGTGADIDLTTSTSELSANWSDSSDPQSGIAKYWYAIGTTAGATDTWPWTDVGLNTAVTKIGLSLTDGQDYYFSVKAENTVFLESNPVSSDGQTVDSSLPVQSNWNPAKGSTLATTTPVITLDTNENATCRWSLTDDDYATMTDTCAGGGTTSHSCSTTGLGEGAEYVYIACEDDFGNEDTAATNEDIDYIIDTTPPAQSAWDPAGGSLINTQSPTITLTTNENATCRWSLTDDDYATMTDTCAGGGTTSHSCDTAGLSEGAETVYIACADAYANEDTAATNTALSYTVDTSPPADIATVNDGTGADIDVTTSGTELSANWTASSDPQTGIAKYWYAIGTTAGATDTVDWTDNGTATSVTKTGLALSNGQAYYFTVIAENGSGMTSNTTSSNGQTANFSDTTPPADITSVSDGTGTDIDVTGLTTQLSANWTESSDAESGILRYWYGIGTTAGGTDIVGWTDNGTAMSVTHTGLSLTDGQAYYFTVKAENGEGLQSNPTDSDGQTVDASPPTDIATVNDGTGADIDLTTSGSELSAVWTESSDPQSGIAKYWYAIGTSPGATDTVPWTNNGLNTTVTKIGLTLIDGQTYYFSVKAENTVFLQSNPTSSDGQTVDISPPTQSNWNPAGGSTLTSTSQTITLDTNDNGTCRWSLTDDDYATMTDTCTGGGTTSHTCNTTGLTEGAEVVYIACADMNGNEDTAATNTELSYTVDTTPPTQSAWNPASGSSITTTSPTITLDTNENATCRWSLADDAYGAMSNTCTGGGTTGHTCDTTGLTEGAEVVYLACADTYGNEDTAATNDELNYNIDTTPPSDIATVNDGSGADIDVTTSATQLSANWTASSDTQTGISKYWYAIGTTPGGTDVANWTNNGLSLSVTRTGLALTNGTTYYFAVKAENGVGLQSNPVSSDGQTVDLALPVQSNWSPADGSTINTASPTIALNTNEDATCRWSLADEAYSTMSNTCTGGGTTSHSCDTAGLTEGAEIAYIACRDTAGNADTAATNTELDYIVDTTPPAQSAWAPASGSSITTTSPTITLDTNENATCKWSLSDDDYATMTDTCTGGGTTSHSCSTSGLSEGAEIVYIACGDANGNEDTASTNTALSYTVDTSAPSDIATVNDGTGADINETTSGTQLSANWTASSDTQSGVSRYLYAIGTTAGGTDVVDWTDNGLDTTVTRTGLALSDATTYYFTVKAENGVGLQSTPTNSDGQTTNFTDSTPPADITTVNDGTGTDVDLTGSTTELSANWTASSDAESGVAKYWYAIGTSAGGTDVVTWTDNGTNLSVTHTGLSLTDAQTYYFSVKAENGVGLQSTPANSDGAVVDASPPADVTVSDGTGADIDSTTSTTELSANWTASSDAQSGVAKYWYAIGTTAGGTDVVSWTDNALNTSVTHTGLSLTNGQTYYFTVTAENGVGLQSTPANSDGQTVDVGTPVQSNWNPAGGSTLNSSSPSITFDTNEDATCRWSLTDDAYGTMTNPCAGGGTTSHTCNTSGLSEGAEVVYTACTDTFNNEDTASSNTELNYTIDTTVPAQSAWDPAGGSIVGTQSPSITLNTNEDATCRWSLTDDDYATMTDTCSGGGTTSHSCDTTGLSEGAEVVYIACADANGNEDTAASNTALSYTVDTSAPTDVATVNDGTGADISETTSGTELSANWTASSDPQTGIAKYWYGIGTSAGATDTVDWTDNALNTSVTHTGLALTNGQTYYFTVKAENGAGVTSTPANSDGQTANYSDSTPPADIATVNDGTGADVDMTGSTSQLSANWTASSDPESGIARYWYAIGTTAGGTDEVAWTDNGTDTSVTHTGLSLTNGQAYYFTVSAENGAGLQSTPTNSDGQTVDATPPSDIVTVNDGTGADIDVTTSSTQLSAVWTESTDTQSGIAKYWYAIGTTAGGTDVVAWTDNALNTSVTHTGLSLTNGQAYYFTVKAENGVGLQSTPTNSDGQTVDDSTPAQSAWSPAGGSTITTTAPAITLSTDENATCRWSLTDDAYGTMTDTCSGGGSTGHTCSASGLSEGAETVYIACADANGNEDSAATNTDLSYAVDTTTPVQSAWSPASGTTLTTNSPAITLSTDESATCRWSLSDDAYGTMTDTCSGGGSTGHTCDTSGLSEGAETVYIACADANGNEDSASTNTALSYTVDTTPPTDITTVNDGTGADIDVTTSATQLSANWTDSSDGQTGIARYWYAIGTTAGGTDVAGWTNNLLDTTMTRAGLSLTEGQMYYITVKAENGAGLESNPVSSDGQTVNTSDTTPPSDVATVNDGTGADIDETDQIGKLSANWTDSADAESGIAKYWYAIGSTAGGTDVVDWTDNATGTSVTHTGLSLTDGQTYYFTVKAENGVGLQSNPANSNGQTVNASDTTPPSDVATVNDGTGADIDETGSPIQLSANWTESADAESGIDRYWYAIGTTAGGTDVVDWTDNATGTSVTHTGLSLTDGQTYYFTVKAENGVGLQSNPANSNGQTVNTTDTTPPSDIATVNDGTGTDIDETDSTTQLSANWTDSADAESSIARYWYAIGTTAGGTDVVDWTDNALNTTVTKTGLSLTDGQTYYFSVKAENGVGLQSSPANSDGQQVVVSTVGEVTSMAAVAGDTEIQLTWTNPSDADFAGTKIIRKTGGYPSSISDGTEVYDGTGEFCADTGLTNGTTYYYAAFAYNGSGIYSTGTGDGARATATPAVPSLVINQDWTQVGISQESASITPEDVFGTGVYEIVQQNDSTLTYLTDQTTVNLEFTKCYWIYSDSDIGAVSAQGTDYTGTTSSIDLLQGWNCVADPFPTAISWGDSNVSLTCGGTPQTLLPLYSYENGSGYVKVEPNTGAKLLPWKGYWLNISTSDCSLTLNK